MAWGRASKRAAIQMANMNFTARDNLDIVCCLYRKQNQLSKFGAKWKWAVEGMKVPLPERMTNGNISFDCERGNGQNCRIGRRFRENALQYADAVTERIIIRVPEVIEVLRHS